MAPKTPNKNLYGAKKIAEHAAEMARRDEKYGQIAIDHERNTKVLQSTWHTIHKREIVSDGIIESREKEIASWPTRELLLKQEIQQQKERKRRDKESMGEGGYQAGKEAVERSVKLEAYLSGKSNEEPK